jgi:hypothetical protein
MIEAFNVIKKLVGLGLIEAPAKAMPIGCFLLLEKI